MQQNHLPGLDELFLFRLSNHPEEIHPLGIVFPQIILELHIINKYFHELLITGKRYMGASFNN